MKCPISSGVTPLALSEARMSSGSVSVTARDGPANFRGRPRRGARPPSEAVATLRGLISDCAPGDYGRGLVQLTWIDNYRKMGAIVGAALVDHPERALEPALSARILIEGMRRGSFTGRKLGHHFPEGGAADWVGARRIINGTDCAEAIAGYGRSFAAALAPAVVPA